MKYINTFSEKCDVSQVSLGCMRIGDKTDKEMDFYLGNAVELGINYFDHADIYGRGKCEEVFGAALKRNPTLRDKMYIQTKCSIVPGSMYDFSKEHIISAVDGSLKRLGVDYVDVLLLECFKLSSEFLGKLVAKLAVEFFDALSIFSPESLVNVKD